MISPNSNTYISMTDNTSLDLFCRINGVSNLIIISLNINSYVYSLKKLVYEEVKSILPNVGPPDLVLWKVHDFEHHPSETISERLQARGTDLSKFCDQLESTKRLSHYFSKQSPDTQLHILVQPPAWAKRKREPPIDITEAVSQLWQSPKVPIPDVGKLAAYLEDPLDEAAKIPLSNSRMRSLVAFGDPTISCTMETIGQVFRESEDETVDYIWIILQYALIRSPPASNGTESAFINFWDNNIRNILEATVYPSESVRDSNQGTSAPLQRPDYGFLVENVCAFRGEEKGPNFSGGRHPRDELREKLTWTYDPAPYILGYHAIGARVTLVAILPSLAIVDLMTTNLSHRSERFVNIKRIIKLCPVILALRNVIGQRNSSEFVPIVQERTGTIILIGASNVRKQYTLDDRVERVTHLRDIYKVLRDKAVPSVDSLLYFDLNDPKHGSVVYLEPKGVDNLPKRAREVHEAVVCVLKALVVMHVDPDPLFHRDIRWPNIVRDARDQTKWFLIDWDGAAMPPTRAAMHLDQDSHSPSVFKNDHGEEVDIWAVGKLIIDARVFAPDVSAELMAVGERMRGGMTTTAEQGLQEMNDLSKCFKFI